ncbi:MAG: UDP-glucose/GDP-mannose dehydrogenase family protein [Burkholderiaceae bacterium]
MKVTIFGSGYVGLVTGACLAEMGNHVICLDVDAEKIRVLQGGGVPIHEPGLEELIRRNTAAGRLQFTTNVDLAVAHGTLQFLAVGTPPGEDGSADLRYVTQAARAIGDRMTDYKVVVDKSTVPVGTGDAVASTIESALRSRSIALDFAVVSNPEFLKEGAAIDDFMKPDRVIVGTDDERAMHLMRSLYSPFLRNRDRLLAMDRRSAELTKYAANAMLATRISFMNELANLAERVGADIELVRQGIGSDPRIGSQFLYPGCGYGGSCFPKDVKALIKTGASVGLDLMVLSAVEEVNARQKQVLVQKVVDHFGENLRGRHFALWGLAFKPGTDDMREAPSLDVVEGLTRRGATICAYDPVAVAAARALLQERGDVSFAADALSATTGADALVVVTEWKEFRSPDFDGLRSRMRSPVVVDGRNLFDPAILAEAGFIYRCVGRSASTLGA